MTHVESLAHDAWTLTLKSTVMKSPNFQWTHDLRRKLFRVFMEASLAGCTDALVVAHTSRQITPGFTPIPSRVLRNRDVALDLIMDKPGEPWSEQVDT